MYIYLLHQRDLAGYDENEGFVVRAPDSRAARELVASAIERGVPGVHGGEGAELWRAANKSSCQRVGQALRAFDKPAILLRSFHAG